jgi:hypothetical protein
LEKYAGHPWQFSNATKEISMGHEQELSNFRAEFDRTAVALAHVDVDYRNRLAPGDIVAALRSLTAADAHVS